MKYTLTALTTLTLIAAFVLTGCNSPSDKTESAEASIIEAKRNMEVAKSEVQEEISLYRANNADRIMDYNRAIYEIKKKIGDKSDNNVEERLVMKLDELETTHSELKREINNYEASGRYNWNNFKNSFDSRMDDLGDSLENFFATTGPVSSNN